MTESEMKLVDLVRELSAFPNDLKVKSVAVVLETNNGTKIDYTFPGGPVMRRKQPRKVAFNED